MIKIFFSNFAAAWKLPKWRIVLTAAFISDIVGLAFTFTPPIHWVIDVITAIVLFITLGFKWALLPALAVEVIPGLQLFPFWTLVILALAGTKSDKKLSENN